MSMFRHVAMLGDGIVPFVTGVGDLDLVEISGKFRLYSAARPIGGGGIASFDVEGAGAAVLLDRLGHSGVSRAGDAPALVVATGWQGDQGMALTAGFLHLAASGVGVAGSTGAVGRRSLLPEGGLPVELRALDRLVLADGRQVLVSLDAGGQAARIWTVTGAGTLAGGAETALAGGGWDRLALADLDGRVLVLAAAPDDHRLTVLLADAAGRLQPVQAIGPEAGIGIARPSALAVVRVGEVPHALVAGAGGSSITVFRIGTDGRLTAVDHVVDGQGTRFAAVSVLETVELAGRAYVLAGGGDQGMSLLLLLPSGRLLHLESLTGTAEVPLGGLTALAARAVPGAGGGVLLQLFAAGHWAGIAQFAVDLGVLEPPQALRGAGALTGGAGGDLLLAGAAGVARLTGGAGDDILVAGGGAATMTGGEGADTFVLAANGALTRITDFNPAQDRLDLSDFPMLRGLGQLTVTVADWGLRLGYGDTVVELVRAGHVALTAAHLVPEWLGGFTRLPIGGIALVLSAGDGGEQLAGLGAADRLTGGRGDDTLSGGAGADTVLGGDGADLLRGEAGRDRLEGGQGADRIDGGTGDDRLEGGRGGDRLDGGKGHDRLQGGRGDDVLRGGAGDDWLLPGPGRDMLYGGAGADTFVFRPDDAASGKTLGRIGDFQPGLDRIDLSAFGLAWSPGGFTGGGAEVWLAARDGYGDLRIDLDGDRRADLSIRLEGTGWLGPEDLLL